MEVANVERIGDYIEITHDDGNEFLAVQPWDVVTLHWGGTSEAIVLTTRSGSFAHVIRTADRDIVTRTLLQLFNDA